MKKFVIFILYLLGALVQFSTGQWTRPRPFMDHYNLDGWGYSHSKMQLPPNHNFIRGRPYSYRPPITTTKAPVRNVRKNDPCAPYDPPLPNFRAPGRRISEVKCFEYIWQLKVREDIKQRQQTCELSRSKLAAQNVVDGHSTSRGDFPNLGAIGWKATVGRWKFLCGGSLISDKFVLTAAHCSSASERDTTIADVVPKIVRLGDKYIGMDDEEPIIINAIDVAIVKIIVHPNFKSPKQYYDIALMELSHKVEFSMDVQPACLWTKENFTQNMHAEVTGWGVTKSGSRETSPELLAADVDIIDSAQCDSLLRKSCNRNWCGLEDHQICAGKIDGGADACQGDSGGPLSIKIPLPVTTQGDMHFILGVTSLGVSCGVPALPGVYTRVSTFVDWIENIVWSEL